MIGLRRLLSYHIYNAGLRVQNYTVGLYLMYTCSNTQHSTVESYGALVRARVGHSLSQLTVLYHRVNRVNHNFDYDPGVLHATAHCSLVTACTPHAHRIAIGPSTPYRCMPLSASRLSQEPGREVATLTSTTGRRAVRRWDYLRVDHTGVVTSQCGDGLTQRAMPLTMSAPTSPPVCAGQGMHAVAGWCTGCGRGVRDGVDDGAAAYTSCAGQATPDRLAPSGPSS